jgi:hypothetical protein
MTGDGSVTGNFLNFLDKNRKSNVVEYESYIRPEYPFIVNQDGELRFEASALDLNVVTGDHSSLLSLNSQTLLEGDEQVSNEGGQLYYDLASGEYFVDIVSGQNVFHFVPELDISNEDIVNYDKRDFATGILIYSTSSFDYLAIDALRSKVDSAYSNASTEVLLFDNYDVFINGQKLKLYEYPDSTVTGNLFAIPKKDRINEVHSDEPDLFGSGFIEGNCDLYLNGMEQITDDILELNTGVHQMIETGIQVFINTRIISEQDIYNL